MRHEVFILYSVEDRSLAEDVCEILEQNNCCCWLASRDASDTQNISALVSLAIDHCKVVIVILSPAANDSDEVLCRLQHVDRQGIPKILIRVGETYPSDALGEYLSIVAVWDAILTPIGAHVSQLLADVRRHINEEEEPELSASIGYQSSNDGDADYGFDIDEACCDEEILDDVGLADPKEGDTGVSSSSSAWEPDDSLSGVTGRGHFDSTMTERDLVDCSVFAPPICSSGDDVLIQVFLHMPDQLEACANEATEFDSTAKNAGPDHLEPQSCGGLPFHSTWRFLR